MISKGIKEDTSGHINCVRFIPYVEPLLVIKHIKNIYTHFILFLIKKCVCVYLCAKTLKRLYEAIKEDTFPLCPLVSS